MTGTKEEAQSIEAQAIARAYRQGQNSQVTLVRFIIKDTIEHEMYVKNYLNNDESQFHGRQKGNPRILIITDNQQICHQFTKPLIK